MRSVRLPRALVLAASLSAVACSSSGRPCSEASPCPGDATCSAGICVGDDAPRAEIARSGALVTNRPIVFDGSGSLDSRPGGRILAYRWSITHGEGGCEPSPASGTNASLRTVFLCPGDYRVSLVVTNDAGIESAPATLGLSLALTPHAPTIEPMTNGTAQHRCSGEPATCVLVGAGGQEGLPLTVHATDAESGTALAYAWSATPPATVDLTSTTIRFEPSATAAAPTLHVEARGRIAGDWKVSVEVTDGDGLVAASDARLTVANTPPQLSLVAPSVSVNHAYDPTARLYRARATFTAQASDPDGDPRSPLGVTPQAELPRGWALKVLSSSFQGEVATAEIELTAEPGWESGFVGPAHPLVLKVRDVNGGEATAVGALTVLNRPPAFVSTSPSVRVPLGYTLATGTYVAAADLAAVVDEDGDPLVAAGQGDAACSEFTHVGGVVRAGCAQPHDFMLGPPNLSRMAGPHALTYLVSDAWQSSPVASTTLEVFNASEPVSPGGEIRVEACQCGPADICGYHHVTLASDLVFTLPVSQADGTPLYVNLAPVNAKLLSPATFSGFPDFPIHIDRMGYEGGAALSVSVSDGLATKTARYTVSVTCSSYNQVCGVKENGSPRADCDPATRPGGH